jgi:DNA-binding transcriptional regulator YiaG
LIVPVREEKHPHGASLKLLTLIAKPRAWTNL